MSAPGSMEARDDFDPSRLAQLGFPRELGIDLIVRSFFEHLEGDLLAAERALLAADPETFKKITHRLKDPAGMLGFPRLHASLAEPGPAADWTHRARALAIAAAAAYPQARTAGSTAPWPDVRPQ